MWNSLTRLWNQSGRKPLDTFQRGHFRPRVELLEEKVVPATVTTSFSGGTLFINAVNLPFNIDQDITLIGTAPNQVIVDGGSTVIGVVNNGGMLNGVRNIVVNFIGGNDVLNTVDLRISGNLTANMGDGNNITNVNGVTFIGGNLTVNGTNGVDIVTATDVVGVGRNVALNLGNNDSIVAFDGPLTVLGNYSSVHGIGLDAMTFNAATRIAGDINLNAGRGLGGAAADISFNDILSGRNIVVSASDGDVAFDTNNNVNARSLTLNLGSGNTTIDISQANAGNVIISNNLTINTGDGNDTIAIGSDGNILTARTIVVNTRTGDSTILLNGTTSVFGPVNLTNVTGAMVVVNDGPFNVAGAYSISNMTGSTIVEFSDPVSAASFTLRNSNGDFNDFVANAPVVVNGLINLIGGDFSDSFTFNSNLFARGMTVTSRDQSSLTFATDVFIDGNFTFSGNGGSNELVVDGQFDVNGNVTINTGAAVDTIDLEVGALSTIAGAVVINTGADTDTVVLDLLAIGGNLTIDNGAGEDETIIGPTDVSVRGNFLWRGGAGNDLFTADFFQVLGASQFNGDDGDDTITLASPNTVLVGLARVNGGPGANDVLVTGAFTLGGFIVGLDVETIA